MNRREFVGKSVLLSALATGGAMFPPWAGSHSMEKDMVIDARAPFRGRLGLHTNIDFRNAVKGSL